MPKTKVLYIHQDGLITGSAISLRHFLSAISRDKFEPVVLLGEEGPARQLYEDLGIQVVVHPFVRFWTFPGPCFLSPSNLRQLKALLPDSKLAAFVKNINPDIIHINDKAAMNAGISLKKLGKPIVQHSRSSYNITTSKTNALLSAKAIARYADSIIAISEDETDGHEGFKNLVTINNTVAEDEVQKALNEKAGKREALGIFGGEIAIGLVGAISAKKGVWNFLDMAASLVKKHPDALLKFVMVGKIPETGQTILNNGQTAPQPPKQYIEDFARNNGLQGKMVVTGFRKDALSVMAGLDILIVANTNGVMGRQPIEAQALGVPVIVAQGHSGKSSILKHNHAGIVISNPVQPDELLQAVEDLINNPEKRKELGRNGQEYAKQKFSPAVNMKLIEGIYEKLLHKN